jgi:hypothetical protein
MKPKHQHKYWWQPTLGVFQCNIGDCTHTIYPRDAERRLNREENRPRYRKVKGDVGFSVDGDLHLHHGVPVIDIYVRIPKTRTKTVKARSAVIGRDEFAKPNSIMNDDSMWK